MQLSLALETVRRSGLVPDSPSQSQRSECFCVWVFSEQPQWIWFATRENESILSPPGSTRLSCRSMELAHEYSFNTFIFTKLFLLAFCLTYLRRNFLGYFSNLKRSNLIFQICLRSLHSSSYRLTALHALRILIHMYPHIHIWISITCMYTFIGNSGKYIHTYISGKYIYTYRVISTMYLTNLL